VSPKAGLESAEKRKNLELPGMEPGPSGPSPYRVIPTPMLMMIIIIIIIHGVEPFLRRR
jgi:hypothetical protein